MIQRPRGTRDFLPEDTWKRNAVRQRMQQQLEHRGYQEIATPTFEHLDLFTIKSGESIIDELYSFKDKGGRDLALRPELTAPVMRMYVNELQSAPKPLRLYYFSNCFRYERPQRGRFREFWQLGAELIGGRRPDSEAETIALAQDMLASVDIAGDLHLGHLGAVRRIIGKIPPVHRPTIMGFIDKKERERLAEYLEEIGADNLGLLDLISLKGRGALDKAIELAQDIAQIPDSEDPMLEGISTEPENLSGGRSARAARIDAPELGLDEFQELIELLDLYGVKAEVDFEIVRGLDYYMGTVFEIYAPGLGAQNQVCGGGTYQLASLFGGKEITSTGFGIGFDRIMEIAHVALKRHPPVVLAFIPEVKGDAIKAAEILRKSIPLVIDVSGRGLGAQLKYASTIGAEHAVIMGQKEVKAGKLVLRDMESGVQECLTLDEIESRLSREYLA